MNSNGEQWLPGTEALHDGCHAPRGKMITKKCIPKNPDTLAGDKSPNDGCHARRGKLISKKCHS